VPAGLPRSFSLAAEDLKQTSAEFEMLGHLRRIAKWVVVFMLTGNK
jgi:hypothetical protein